MCAVCHDMLHIRIDQGISEWRHPLPATDENHSPRPVLPDDTARRFCSFCDDPNVQWLLPTADNNRPWIACTPCHELVAAGRGRDLVSRAVEFLPQRSAAFAAVPPAQRPRVVAEVHSAYWVHASGTGVPVR